MVYWEGDYTLNEERQIKWCKPTGVNATDLLEWTEKLIFYSRLSALALLSLLCVSVMAAVIYSDCKSGTLQQLNKHDEPTRLTSLSGSEVEPQQRSV
ncbi:hypothetical protein R3I93_017082 [Phoxinus phoxinus]|uniref:Uncharacterized protein n=1 Tax=Phoxinus phoxinus TaxID=58324 RepID=A0AAN9GYI2_9TELE